MLARVPAITRIVNVALRISDRSTSGQRTRRSTTTKPPSNTSDTTSATIVVGETHPHDGARSKVNVNRPTQKTISAKPERSIRRGTVLSLDSVMDRAPITNDSTVNGTLSQKIQRQPRVSVS